MVVLAKDYYSYDQADNDDWLDLRKKAEESSSSIFSRQLLILHEFRVGRFSRLKMHKILRRRNTFPTNHSLTPFNLLIFSVYICSRVLAIKSLSTLINQQKKTTVLSQVTRVTWIFCLWIGLEFGYLHTSSSQPSYTMPAIFIFI